MSFLDWLYQKSKREIAIVLATLVVLVSLPITTLVVFASSGIAIVSETLAAINPVTHLVEIFDPDGKKVQALELSTVWPTTGVITSEFGAQEAFRVTRNLGAHTGIDIASESGLSGAGVTTFMTGVVIKTQSEDKSLCGKFVKIDHGYNITSLYCHLDSTNTIEGAEVTPGDIIGYMGSTGESTGPHVHFQVMVYDIPVNPRSFMVGQPTGTYDVKPSF